MGIPHLALDLRLRRQCRDRVDHDHVDRAGTHEHVGDLECLIARVGLRDQQFVDVDPELLGVGGIECVLGVDEGTGTAVLLTLGDDLQHHGGLARRFRAIDLHDPPAGQPAYSQRHIQRQGTRGNHGYVAHGGVVAHAHDGALAELLLDLAERCVQRLFAILIHAQTSINVRSRTTPGASAGLSHTERLHRTPHRPSFPSVRASNRG